MIATAPVAARTETTRPGLDHLLLGDLRELLEEPAGGMRDRWLLATLDMLLMSRPRSDAAIPRPNIGCDRATTLLSRMPSADSVSFGKLQRLRDRIVHRAPAGVLIQELKDDLHAYFD